MAVVTGQSAESEWITFPGGELEGRRPKVLCTACRARLEQAAAGPGGPSARPTSSVGGRALCFQCYRAELEREHALAAAGQLDTASVERFQAALPFEPVNVPRLEMLKVERLASRAASAHGVAQFVDKRRRAQIAARHALQRIVAGVTARKPALPGQPAASDRERTIAAAIHAAELQLPESWIPFVVAR
jgi:hypothetical protein